MDRIRFKQRRDRRTGVSRLFIELEKGAELDYLDASKVEGGIAPFMECRHSTKGKAIELAYLIGPDPTSLSKRLGDEVPRSQLHGMLRSFLVTMRSCEENSLSIQRVVFDPEHIYCDVVTGELSFAYVPIRSFVSVDHDIRGALLYLCRSVRTESSQDEAIVERIEEEVLRTVMLNSVDYKSLLKELGVLGESERNYPMQSGTTVGAFGTARFGSDRLTSFGFDFVQEQASMGSTAPDDAMPASDAPFTLLLGDTGNGWRMTDGRYTIGRAAHASINLARDAGVSRIHATITVNGPSVTVRDESSTNGTKVNGNRISPGIDVPIHRGDRLTIGSESLVLR